MKKSLRLFLVVVSFFSVSISAFGQESHTGISTSPKKFKKHLAVGGAYAYSVINNRLEVRGQYKPGFNFNLNYCTKPWFAWSAEYSWYFPHNSSPGLENIQSWNTELNGNFQMSMAGSDLKFRTVFGLSYLNWHGTYVGPNLIDNSTWYYGKIIKQNWVAGNLGVGFGHKIGREFTGYADFRIRFASEDKDLISISDTGFFFGCKWEPNFQNDKESSNHNNKGKKPNPKNGSGHLYKWLKKRN